MAAAAAAAPPAVATAGPFFFAGLAATAVPGPGGVAPVNTTIGSIDGVNGPSSVDGLAILPRRLARLIELGEALSTCCAALLSSMAFLVCYLIYHYNVPEKSSGLPPGIFRTAYLLMLLTHVVLAVVMLPMIFITLFRAYRREWDRHKRIAHVSVHSTHIAPPMKGDDHV